MDWHISAGRPGALFNGMVNPLAPFSLAGVVWYQGESNVDWPRDYRSQLPALIADWRAVWGKDFPFLYVQLPNYGPRCASPCDDPYAQLREAQAMAFSVRKTGMAVTIDLGDEKNIHPPKKQEVGRRLALAALAAAYGKTLVHSGPMYESMAVEGDNIRLRFRHGGSGLVARSEGPTGFAIAGEDKKFVWADARIDSSTGPGQSGDSVLVRSPQVPRPVAVRYAWAANPECNLYNAEGLPASPFRTDDWEGPGKRGVHLPSAVWYHMAWMLIAIGIGTWSGYLGLLRATQKDGRSFLPGRYTLRAHQWTGIVYYTMLYLGILGGYLMAQFCFADAKREDFWAWHARLAIAIGLLYAPAAALGLHMWWRPVGASRVRPIAHMILNFIACALIGLQAVLAILKAKGVI